MGEKNLDSGSISEASAYSSCLMRFVRVPVEIVSTHQKVAEPNLSLCMNWILSFYFWRLREREKELRKCTRISWMGNLFILSCRESVSAKDVNVGSGNKEICRRTIWIEFLSVSTIYHSREITRERERETNLMPLGALFVYWSTRVLSKWSNDMQKRPVGHTSTCGGVTTVCGRSAEQKRRIKIHGIIKFTVRPTWNWSTRRKNSSSSPAIGIYSIYTPTDHVEGKKKKKKEKLSVQCVNQCLRCDCASHKVAKWTVKR